MPDLQYPLIYNSSLDLFLIVLHRLHSIHSPEPPEEPGLKNRCTNVFILAMGTFSAEIEASAQRFFHDFYIIYMEG